MTPVLDGDAGTPIAESDSKSADLPDSPLDTETQGSFEDTADDTQTGNGCGCSLTASSRPGEWLKEVIAILMGLL